MLLLHLSPMFFAPTLLNTIEKIQSLILATLFQTNLIEEDRTNNLNLRALILE